MNMDNQLLFFFSALGAFNSSLLSLYYLFFAKQKHVSNYFLGTLLLVLSIRIWKSIFFYFNPELSKTYLQIGLMACFLIDPLLYFYVKSKLKYSKTVAIQSQVVLIPLVLLLIVIGLLFPYKDFPNLWGDYFYPIINYSWFFFVVLTGILCKYLFRKLIQKKEKLTYDDIWVLSIFFGVSIIWLAYFTASYTSYILGALSFSFALYLSLLLIYYKQKKTFNVAVKKEKYASKKINEQEAGLLLKKIEKLMESELLYKNANLTVSELSKKIGVRSDIVSQLLNDNLNKNFPNFINEYRILEAKKLLKTQQHLKMEIIAEACGFNSTSTFYSAFKNVTGTTPAKYAKNVNS
ncbi:helix-turn-helix domain-containing protein [Tenacibaculum retecalamus]|uniref:helix-turn-helix domain-containing protein n=1 Tax=Tenacibaculum retecalamus TaxID=3018315 RepID=UPI0023D96C16|nr:helix-turn-helix transcriptional regulator [Tenacibaculum retecalamus]WBX71076.1 helix-turn-helix transcriptional regulator [Tenacibaculum retecalamus]